MKHFTHLLALSTVCLGSLFGQVPEQDEEGSQQAPTEEVAANPVNENDSTE